LPRIPFGPMECLPRSVPAGSFVVGEFCGRVAVFDRVRWHDVSRPDLDGWGLLVPAGPVVLALGRSDPGRPPALFAYRPGG
jgi:hypothetical protein